MPPTRVQPGTRARSTVRFARAVRYVRVDANLLFLEKYSLPRPGDRSRACSSTQHRREPIEFSPLLAARVSYPISYELSHRLECPPRGFCFFLILLLSRQQKYISPNNGGDARRSNCSRANIAENRYFFHEKNGKVEQKTLSDIDCSETIKNHSSGITKRQWQNDNGNPLSSRVCPPPPTPSIVAGTSAVAHCFLEIKCLLFLAPDEFYRL